LPNTQETVNGLISTVRVAFDKPMESWFVTASAVDFVADVDSFGWVFADEFEDCDLLSEAQFA